MSDWTLSVGELNEYVRRRLASDPVLSAVRVRGEISGFKRHISGHLYFALKDENARVNCVMFRQAAQRLSFVPTDGEKVTVEGSASLYTQGGSFQVYCERMEKEGAGALFLRFEALKKKLAQEGLFDPALKKPLPVLPRRVGIVTSRSGAALQDMLRVAKRRAPGISILFCHAAVQGEGAAQEIVRALDALNENGTCDVILCGRGGGSMEDLFAFNEEIVARAIARSAIPVVSCVGHETDFTIADFVADARAATPSMAAELAVPQAAEWLSSLSSLNLRARRALLSRVELYRARLTRLAHFYESPQEALVGGRRTRLSALGLRLENAQKGFLSRKRSALAETGRALAALNPRSVLGRGYAVLYKGSRVATDIGRFSPGDGMTVEMRDGRATATVNEVKKHDV